MFLTNDLRYFFALQINELVLDFVNSDVPILESQIKKFNGKNLRIGEGSGKMLASLVGMRSPSHMMFRPTQSLFFAGDLIYPNQTQCCSYIQRQADAVIDLEFCNPKTGQIGR